MMYKNPAQTVLDISFVFANLGYTAKVRHSDVYGVVAYKHKKRLIDTAEFSMEYGGAFSMLGAYYLAIDGIERHHAKYQ